MLLCHRKGQKQLWVCTPLSDSLSFIPGNATQLPGWSESWCCMEVRSDQHPCLVCAMSSELLLLVGVSQLKLLANKHFLGSAQAY